MSETTGVRVGTETRSVETPLYWSPERLADDDGTIWFTWLSLTISPARVNAQPVTFLQGALDHREAANRWQLDTAAGSC